MDKTKRETYDSMNVDSFSRLPFLRLEPPTKEKGIRLFGIEFGDASESESTETTTNENTFELDGNNNNNKDNNNNGESGRRFECHYCRRNFPTSQAFGGHQNAHKRERQQARKAQLHSAMVHSYLPADAWVYGLMNYRFGSGSGSASSMSYPTWNRKSNNSPSAIITSSGGGGRRFYGSSCSQQHPINGSPLALWRIPTATGIVQGNPIFNRERRSLHPLPLFASEEVNTRMGPSRLAPTQNRYVYPSKPSVNDHVSLDLRL